MKKILLLTDNEELLLRFLKLMEEKKFEKRTDFKISYAYSENNKYLSRKFKKEIWIRPLLVKKNIDLLIKKYDIIISLHCNQIFPEELVENVRCINIHPGYNPYNRGVYPQIFSIINGFPCGATIHEMDNKIDHGPIICQKKVKVEIWDTSLTVYDKIIDAEIQLLTKHFERIINNDYRTIIRRKGNINSKSDFLRLCEIDLSNKDTFLNHINKLRALTHGNYRNGYFMDSTGQKVFVRLELINEHKK
jgi:dTDP-4-amino-4,6-dideoxyglucose formyltransferase